MAAGSSKATINKRLLASIIIHGYSPSGEQQEKFVSDMLQIIGSNVSLYDQAIRLWQLESQLPGHRHPEWFRAMLGGADRPTGLSTLYNTIRSHYADVLVLRLSPEEMQNFVRETRAMRERAVTEAPAASAPLAGGGDPAPAGADSGRGRPVTDPVSDSDEVDVGRDRAVSTGEAEAPSVASAATAASERPAERSGWGLPAWLGGRATASSPRTASVFAAAAVDGSMSVGLGGELNEGLLTGEGPGVSPAGGIN